jgi:hypothetical protein
VRGVDLAPVKEHEIRKIKVQRPSEVGYGGKGGWSGLGSGAILNAM